MTLEVGEKALKRMLGRPDPRNGFLSQGYLGAREHGLGLRNVHPAYAGQPVQIDVSLLRRPQDEGTELDADSVSALRLVEIATERLREAAPDLVSEILAIEVRAQA